jgi:hypothetical protein
MGRSGYVLCTSVGGGSNLPLRTSFRLTGLVVLVAAFSIAACGQEDAPASLERGTITVRFSPKPFAVSGLTVVNARMRIGDVLVLGNVPPPPPPPRDRPPPDGLPPPPPSRFELDALSEGTEISFYRFPQGLYSRVLFLFDRVSLEGTWNGTPFRASLVNFMPLGVDLRSPAPQELGPGLDAAFAVSVDPAAWFANRLLDYAMIVDGQILCDEQHNGPMANMLTQRIATSFALQ